MQPSNIITICLDFDLSITAYHIHNVCCEIVQELQNNHSETAFKEYQHNPDIYLWNRLKETKRLSTFGKPEEWKQFINSYLSNGYHFAINTRCAFPTIVKRFLQEIIGVDISKIHFETGATLAPNKIGHMQRTLKYFHQEIFDGSLAGAILLDDSDEDFNLIQQLGGRTIKLPQDASNLLVAKQLLPKEIANAKAEIAKALTKNK